MNKFDVFTSRSQFKFARTEKHLTNLSIITSEYQKCFCFDKINRVKYCFTNYVKYLKMSIYISTEAHFDNYLNKK